MLEENLRIDGEIEGTITIRGKQLVIGKRALVKAAINAGTVEVHGKVEGDVHGDELVHIYATATINGSIFCKRIVIDDGARFNGLFRTSAEATKKSSSSEATPLPDSKRTNGASENKATLSSVS